MPSGFLKEPPPAPQGASLSSVLTKLTLGASFRERHREVSALSPLCSEPGGGLQLLPQEAL